MKLKASLSQFGLVLDRHATIPGGEAKLFIAVICQAYGDIQQLRGNGRPPLINAEAVRFFFDGRMDLFADRIGIDPAFVREMLCRSAPDIKDLI
jgi:hypothetical protein